MCPPPLRPEPGPDPDAAHQRAAAPAIRVASLHKIVAVSAPVRLPNAHPAFYLAVPVDGHRFSGSLSKAESQSALVGLVDAQVFALQALGGGSPAFRLRDGATLLAAGGSDLTDALHAAIPAAGRQWNLAVGGGALTPIQVALPWLVLVFGFSLAAAVLVILGNAARRRDQALQLAEERWDENQRPP